MHGHDKLGIGFLKLSNNVNQPFKVLLCFGHPKEVHLKSTVFCFSIEAMIWILIQNLFASDAILKIGFGISIENYVLQN
jgi:hypothetical protein